MGQIGPDITFDELKKQYLDALKLLNTATTRAETAEGRIVRARKDERAVWAAWVLERWDAEVALRPSKNIHRRTLDDTWRQMYRSLTSEELPRALLTPAPATDGGEDG